MCRPPCFSLSIVIGLDALIRLAGSLPPSADSLLTQRRSRELYIKKRSKRKKGIYKEYRDKQRWPLLQNIKENYPFNNKFNHFIEAIKRIKFNASL
jgi:hypothetical protein